MPLVLFRAFGPVLILALALAAFDFHLARRANGPEFGIETYGRLWQQRMESWQAARDRETEIEQRFADFSADVVFGPGDAAGHFRAYTRADGEQVTGKVYAPSVLAQGTTMGYLGDLAEAADLPHAAARVFDGPDGIVIILLEVHRDFAPATIEDWRGQYQEAVRATGLIPRTWGRDATIVARHGPFAFSGGDVLEQPVTGMPHDAGYRGFHANLLRQYEITVLTDAGDDTVRAALAALDVAPLIRHAGFDPDVESVVLAGRAVGE